ncbi:zinc finger protein basonuclin-2-like [Conger conger]|uniref:zinc finger protein basonuclin-2-like n=1 Tax=Conger conger TaxID=82655 RepID=UPI002A5A7DB6|nr:zinc finger protein basonuclin-2-like [Conger conger]
MGAWKLRNDSILLHTMSQQASVALPLKCDRSTMGRHLDEAIRCTLLNCACESFQPGKISLRTCDHCKHGWVAHALDKLSTQHLYHPAQVELVQSSVVFDISSLILYGTQALPVRLKILLDRLFSVLKQDEILHILHSLGWTLRDYVRGYILQDTMGKVLDRWSIMSQEEEVVTLQQFLRFGETKTIVELMALQEQEGRTVTMPPSEGESGIRTFIESTSPTRSPALLARLQGRGPDSVHYFENLPNSLAFLLPFQYINTGSAPSLGLPANGLTRSPSLPANGLTQELGLPNQSEPVEVKGSEASLSPCSSLGAPVGRMDPKVEPCSTPPHSPSPPQHPHLLKPGPRSLPFGTLSSRPHRMRRLGAASRKGRVCCSSCGKTFYDKGTLKIHFNAVHLKIKHRCTVQGCNMVFSSLRSRNRHSANPNPRLHLPVLRNNRDRDLIRSASHAHSTTAIMNGPTHSATPVISAVPVISVHMATPLLPVTPTSSLDPQLQGSLVFPSLKSVQPAQPIPPFYRPLVPPPGALVHSPVSLTSPTNGPSLTHPISCSPRLPLQDPGPESAPKKKPRKSSMPVKIETEAMGTAGEYKEVEDPGDNHGNNNRSVSNSIRDSQLCSPSPGERSSGPAPPWTCYVCQKSFRSSYSVKLHFRNVHLKEMHICTLSGCSAAFPSRRSRDRHSSNINLHRKLLTKELDHLALDSPPTPLPPILSGHEQGAEAVGGREGGRGRGEEFCPMIECGSHSPERSISAELRSTSSAWSSNSAESDPGSNEGALLNETEAVGDGDYICQKAEQLGDTGLSESLGCSSEAAGWQQCDPSPLCHNSAPSPCNSSPLSQGSSPAPATPPPLQCCSGPLGAVVSAAFRGSSATKPSAMEGPCGSITALSSYGSMLRSHARFPCRDRRSQNPTLHKNTAPLTAMMD